MDIGSVAALLSVLVALIATIWSIVKDRSRLSTLERVVALTKELPEGSAQRKILEDMRDLHSYKLGLSYLRPRYTDALVFSWILILVGTAMLIRTSYFMELKEAEALSWAVILPLAVGYFILGTRAGFQRLWTREARARRLAEIHDDSILALLPARSRQEDLMRIYDATLGMYPIPRRVRSIAERLVDRTRTKHGLPVLPVVSVARSTVTGTQPQEASMTEQSSAPAEPDEVDLPTWREQDDPDGLTSDDIFPRDWALFYLLNATLGFDDDKPNSFGLTMVCGGQIISGMVISRKAWFEGTQRSLTEKAGAPEMAEGLGIVADSMTKQDAESRARREAADLPARVRGFIHLRDVQLTRPNGDVLNFDLWRANINEVSGWSLSIHNLKGA